ncbi:hypothetical protein NLU13_1796 [Sarocladium strictum]|uniref:DNA mismatch repair protein S5 domain-containing protein n=1 Tax=Sarocladium strictum TaxID=5046 RepID=A0AA39LCP9_SARSR|nr:hypothetical protein NLU13_1796 [Sarocladium strictum]
MTIQALPQATQRLLGASAHIVTPLSLTTELVENALDAGASSVEVQISPDTIGKIQVRDNGSGIPFGDLDCLGQASHTSKLTSFEQLQAGEVRTFGFRGEALAHAKTIATISITTRTKDDPVGTKADMELGKAGVQKKQPVSGPVGTTVRAVQLFESLPVRKQNYLKDSRKSIMKIKEMLTRYALIQPSVRFSLKEAAIQLFGRDVASEYVAISTPRRCSAVRTHTTRADSIGHVSIEAILPKNTCLGTPRKGRFLFVNNRPISATRGLGKKLVSIVKKHFQHLKHTARFASNMLIVIAITCDRSMCDPNVSPQKDEIMLGDDFTILDCLESLCRELYSGDHADAPYSPEISLPSAGKSHVPRPDIETAPADGGDPGETWRPLSTTSALESPIMSDTKPETVVESEFESMPVRTIMSVNMARTSSNVTDAAAEVDMITICVPKQPNPSAPTTPSRDNELALTRMGASLLSQDIERYFKPRKDNQFVIAEDETATCTSPDLCQDAVSRRLSDRHPLHNLTESALNTHHDSEMQNEDSGDDVDVEHDTVSLLFEPARTARVPLPALRTPPASISTRRMRNFQPPRPAITGSGIRRGQGSQGQTHSTASRERGNPYRSAPISPQVRLVNSDYHHPASSFGPVDGAQDGSGRVMEASADRLSVNTDSIPPGWSPRGWKARRDGPSRSAQLNLMQTPAPESKAASSSAHGDAPIEVPHTGLKLSDEDVEDPRRYLMERQRSVSQDGRRKRMLSSRLPLENIGDGTYCLRYTIHGGLPALTASQNDKYDHGIAELIKVHEVPGELETVRSRLNTVIRRWASSAHPSVDVTYAFRPLDKGQNKVKES